MSKWCLVLVANRAFLDRLQSTVQQARRSWKDDIVVIHGPELACDPVVDRLVATHGLKRLNRDLIDLSRVLEHIQRNPFRQSDGRELRKTFQWHKLYVFDPHFASYDRVLYVDAGMHIFGDLNRFRALDAGGRLLAHSDAYPSGKWRLRGQFEEGSDVSAKLVQRYELDVDYFQTGMLLYDTVLLRHSPLVRLLELMNEFPVSRTNEQGIMNLLFNCELRVWQPLPTKDSIGNLYDAIPRSWTDDYLMLKNPGVLSFLGGKLSQLALPAVPRSAAVATALAVVFLAFMSRRSGPSQKTASVKKN